MERIQQESISNDERIVQDARAWFIKINHGEFDDASRKLFENWLAAHKDHQNTYDDVCIFMQETDNYIRDPLCVDRYNHLLTVGAKRQESYVANIVEFLRQTKKSCVFHKKFLLGSMVASLFLLLSITFIVQIFINGGSYQTAIGEQKTITLADGSKVKLNTNTKITVDFSDLDRSVILDQGQAYFIVTKNPKRPFIVNFDSGSVTAIGTEFEVYNKGQEVVVSLVEGKVKVRPNQVKVITTQSDLEEIVMATNYDLAIGAQISLSQEHISTVTKTDNKLINAWQKEQLIFREASLEHVVSEINRYSRQRIILAQPSLGDKIISGVFPIDSAAAIGIISKYFDLTKSANDNGDIILAQSNQL